MTMPKLVRALGAAFLLAFVSASVVAVLAYAAPQPEAPGVSRVQDLTASVQAQIVRDHRQPGSSPVVRDHRETTTEARQKSLAQRMCEARGFQWIGGVCADKSCRHGSGLWGPGETRNEFVGGQWQIHVCDGRYGTWYQLRTQADDNPVRPGNTGTNAPVWP